MTKQLVISAALLASGLFAQHTQHPHPGNSFQNPDFMSGPSTSGIEGAQTGPIAGRPFSATEIRKTVQTLADGTRLERSDTSRFYRDGYGRMRVESPNRVEIFDFINGIQYDLQPAEKSYEKKSIPNYTKSVTAAVVGGRSSTSFSSDAPEARLNRKPRGALTEDLPSQTFNGFMMKGSRVTVAIPVGAIGNDRELKVISERWYSPDLQVLVKSSNSDPRFGVSSYELTDIVQGPPDPLLFQVPADYNLKANH
jgi:hypothetical protein